MADSTDRGASSLIPVVGGALAAVVVVALAWFALRDDDTDDVVAAVSSTTSTEGTAPTSSEDSASDTTEPDGSTTPSETTTIDDVPLSDLPPGAPNVFVAVTNDTFQLVQVDSRTGEILVELGSWGSDDGGGEPDQVLQTVELSPIGTIYVDDCCEPAYGSTFIVSGPFDPTTAPRLDGISPEASTDGTRLARSSLGSAIAITDGEGAALGQFGDPDFTGPVLAPLTWVDSATLVVSETDPTDDLDRLVVLDVGDPGNPVEIAAVAEPGRQYVAGDVRADGNVLVVVRLFDPGIGPSDSDDVIAEIIDPNTGETIADFDLPDDVYEANYDASGRFVVTVRANGQLDWYGAGQRGTLAVGFVSADW